MGIKRAKNVTSGNYLGWKYPGGAADPHEDIFDAGVREVFEETGVQTEPVCLLCFRLLSILYALQLSISQKYYVVTVHSSSDPIVWKLLKRENG